MLEKVKYELFKPRHVREIYLLYLIVLSIFFFMIYTSLAIFQKQEAIGDVAIIKSGMISVNITSNTGDYNKDTGEITVGAGEVKLFDLTLTNNTSTNIKYKLYYQAVNPGVLPKGVNVGISDDSNNTEMLEKVGNPNVSKTVKVGVINNSTQSVTVKIGADTGYGHNDVTLSNDKTELGYLDELLSRKILANNTINTNKPDFNKATETDEEMYKDVDADGNTYYFRGAAEDNYVKIEGLKWYEDDGDYHQAGDDMLFRIVRVNGDGTIRIIANGSIGKSMFNSSNNQEKFSGYTFDNSKKCTNNDRCNGTEGTDSEVKKFLDDWYNKNMKKYDSLFATTRYCNDTSISNENGYIYYGIDKRNTPSYICPNTDKLYGGEYDLKIGLLSADEVKFAGGVWGFDANDYLANNFSSSWLGTPLCFDENVYSSSSNPSCTSPKFTC